MSKAYYISSCVFTSQFPELSSKIRKYVSGRFGLDVVRCCVPKYKIQQFESKMPEGKLYDEWHELTDSADFKPGDAVYSLCHNCNNIIEERHPGVQTCSLWELIDNDEKFCFPDYSGLKVTIQDCWRSRERATEHEAVRSLLKKMNIDFLELPGNRGNTAFCGNSLYRAQPPRNPKLAPKHYAEGVEGLFIPHSEEEQKQIMKTYCNQFKTDIVVCYCHYCLEGLIAGDKDGRHIAQLVFAD